MTSRWWVPAWYDWLRAAGEAKGLADRRRRLVGSARGRVLEIGAGTGRNLAFYRAGQVSSLLALEPDRALGERLRRRAVTLGVPFEWRPVALEAAVLPKEGFDTVVVSFGLCRVADPAAAAERIATWLVPGGRLLFLEHVASVGPAGSFQRAATPLWSRLAAGCHLDRPTVATLRAAGLSVSDCTRFRLPAAGPLAPLFASCVAAVAWRPPIGEPDPAMSVLAAEVSSVSGDAREWRPPRGRV
ncbi:MAG: class I SAM-dependent methyltransferase [Acidimicrobiales bacterium]